MENCHGSQPTEYCTIVYDLKYRNTMWLGGIACACNDVYMHSLSASCVSMPEWHWVCSYFLCGHMWLHCPDMLWCPDLRLKTASSSEILRNFFLYFALLFGESPDTCITGSNQSCSEFSLDNLSSALNCFKGQRDQSKDGYFHTVLVWFFSRLEALTCTPNLHVRLTYMYA